MIGNLIVWVIVGLVAGYLASKVLRGKGMGLPMDLAWWACSEPCSVAS
ncbi:MAG TPA: hypothetical protein VNG93_14920 [Candidatus Dormibacteraeota bacterium]|nr:hypothetical protein [Candidatus Dormibacteraeota bacterium]